MLREGMPDRLYPVISQVFVRRNQGWYTKVTEKPYGMRALYEKNMLAVKCSWEAAWEKRNFMGVVILLDVIGVILGTALGCLVRSKLSDGMKESMNLALAVVSLAIGIGLLNKGGNLTVAVLAFLMGGILGHCLGLDRGLLNLSKKLPSAHAGGVAETLLTAFTLYCVSVTGIIGVLTMGTEGDTSVLITKSVMDCVASILFAASSGWAVALISIPLGIILSVLYVLAGAITPLLTPQMIADFSACGGLLQFLNALRMTKLKNPPVADYIPGLVLSVFFSRFLPL